MWTTVEEWTKKKITYQLSSVKCANEKLSGTTNLLMGKYAAKFTKKNVKKLRKKHVGWSVFLFVGKKKIPMNCGYLKQMWLFKKKKKNGYFKWVFLGSGNIEIA